MLYGRNGKPIQMPLLRKLVSVDLSYTERTDVDNLKLNGKRIAFV